MGPLIDLSVGAAKVILHASEPGKRGYYQYAMLMKAMQMVDRNQHFDIKPLSLKAMLKSNRPELVAEAWGALYHKWGFDYSAGPSDSFPKKLIDLEILEGNIPIWISPAVNQDNFAKLELGILGTNLIKWKSVGFSDINRGWYFVSASATPPIWTEKEESDYNNRLHINLLGFLVFFGLAREIHGSRALKEAQTEVLPRCTYGKEKKAPFVTYSDFSGFSISTEEPVGQKKIGKRSYFSFEGYSFFY